MIMSTRQSYRDLTREPRDKTHLPCLTKLENRMRQSLLNTPGDYARKTWCYGKSKTMAHLLIGTKRKNAMSGSETITFQKRHVPIHSHDPLKRGNDTFSG